MRVGFRPPLLVLAVALLGLILLLATLQYVWLGRISEAERERLRATLNRRTSEFAQDFDRELTRAYLLFQADACEPTIMMRPHRLCRSLRSLARDVGVPESSSRISTSRRAANRMCFTLQQFDPPRER